MKGKQWVSKTKQPDAVVPCSERNQSAAVALLNLTTRAHALVTTAYIAIDIGHEVAGP